MYSDSFWNCPKSKRSKIASYSLDKAIELLRAEVSLSSLTEQKENWMCVAQDNSDIDQGRVSLLSIKAEKYFKDKILSFTVHWKFGFLPELY